MLVDFDCGCVSDEDLLKVSVAVVVDDDDWVTDTVSLDVDDLTGLLSVFDMEADVVSLVDDERSSLTDWDSESDIVRKDVSDIDAEKLRVRITDAVRVGVVVSLKVGVVVGVRDTEREVLTVRLIVGEFRDGVMTCETLSEDSWVRDNDMVLVNDSVLACDGVTVVESA